MEEPGRKPLRLFEATTLVVGAMIGSGILILPGLMIAQARSPWLVVIALVAAGALSCMGCLVMAELASAFPRAGGQYHYLREGLGPVWGYLFGWGMFWLVLTGILAGIAAAFGGFVNALVPLPGRETPLVIGGFDTKLVLPPWGGAFVAIALIWSLVALNWLGARVGGLVSNVTTIAKYAGLLALVALLLVVGERAPDAFVSAGGGAFGGASVAGFAAALAFGLFAFDGWVAVTYVASEVENAKRTLPIALVVGPLVVAAIYVLLTAAYFVALPAAEAVAVGESADRLIAIEAARAAIGPGMGTFIAVVALVSLFGAANAFVLAVPRIFHAMARDGALFSGMAKLAGPAQVPVFATFMLALWASLLVLSGLYASIVYMVVFGQWLFYALTAVAHLRLRRTQPGLARPFRTPLAPVVPVLFLLAATFIVVSMLGQSDQRPYALLAVGLVAAGVPFHFAQR